MSLKNRLKKLEKTVGGRFRCSHCHDDPIAPVCAYEEDANGRYRRVVGTPQPNCPACGRAASKRRVAAIIIRASGSRSQTLDAADLKKAFLKFMANVRDAQAHAAGNDPPRSDEGAMESLRAILHESNVPDPFPDWTDARRYLAVTWALLTSLLGLSGPNRQIMPGEELATPTEAWRQFWFGVSLESLEELCPTPTAEGLPP
jgi:hypothetical protein